MKGGNIEFKIQKKGETFLSDISKTSDVSRTRVWVFDADMYPSIGLGYFQQNFAYFYCNLKYQASYPCMSVEGPTRVH